MLDGGNFVFPRREIAKVEGGGRGARRKTPSNRRPPTTLRNYQPPRTILFNRAKVQEVRVRPRPVSFSPRERHAALRGASPRRSRSPDARPEKEAARRGRAKRRDPAGMSKYLSEQMISPG